MEDLLKRLELVKATGSTPTAAALRALKPKLAGLGGKTFAVLLTDGAPNCNARLTCDPDACIPNIERRFKETERGLAFAADVHERFNAFG